MVDYVVCASGKYKKDKEGKMLSMSKEKPTTKVCKHCKTEIPYEAKICPQCRKKQKSSGCLMVIIGIIVIFIAGSCFAGGSSANAATTELKNEENTETTTPATAAKESENTVTIDEQILLEKNGLRVTAKELVNDSIWGKGIKVLIENDNDKNVRIICKALIVNNYMISDLFSATVASGKKSNETIYLLSSQLEASGIDNIGEIEIYFHVFDSDSHQTYFDSERVVIQTSDYANMDSTALDDGKELLNQNGIRVVGKYVDNNSFWGKAVLLYIENTSGKNVGVSCDNMSVNGFKITPLFLRTVYDGKMAIDDIKIMSSDLEDNGIESVDNIELKFRIYDNDSYSTIFESEIIAFSVE